MKSTSTIVCCALLAIFGACIADMDNKPSNTISAETKPINLTTKHDTIKINTTVRDTVRIVKTKTRIRTKHVPYAVKDTIPILYIKTCGDRMEAPPDSIPKPKYTVKEAIEL